MDEDPKPIEPQPPSKFESLDDERPLSLIQEFWLFIREDKAWWMVPILVVLGLVGLLVTLGATGAAPFIYTLF